MTPARTRANGLVIPSLPQQWLGAMLRALVELVLDVVSTIRMVPSRLPAECHSDVPPQALAGMKTDTQQQETRDRRALAWQSTRSVETDAAAHDDDRATIITSATPTESFSGLSRESRLARHRDRQLTVRLVPMEVGTQGETRVLLRTEASIPLKTHHRPWISVFAGMSGIGLRP